MADTPQSRSEMPSWSFACFGEGARLAMPATPVMAMFGMAFGAFAAQKGLTLLEAALMSALMFAGASQFVAADIWPSPMTFHGIVTLALVTAMVNVRFVLITASLQPWLGGLPPWRTYPALSLVTEPGWLVAMRYRSEGGTDPLMLLSSGVTLWLVWIGGTVPGHLLGSLVANPKTFGLDLVLPIFFIVLLLPLWRGGRPAIPWAIAGAAALLAAEFIPGWWYIVIGAISGSLAAGALNDLA